MPFRLVLIYSSVCPALQSRETSDECPHINKLGDWPTKRTVFVEAQLSESQYRQMHGFILTRILPEIVTFIFLETDSTVKDIMERL